jgi:hypothetical protein
MSATAFAALRKLVRPRAGVERCEFCASELPAEHRHVVEPAVRRLVCSCRACALLFGGRLDARYRLVPEEVRLLTDFRMTDAQWEDLHLPISLAFFFHSSAASRVVAVYPSPAGPTESLLPLESWQELAAENPCLQEMEPDVEALLVNRVKPACDHYRVGIDECYKLVGILRTNWHGLSGGAQLWEEVGGFFDKLKERSHSGKEARDA